MEPSVEKEEIFIAGERILLALYNLKSATLDLARYESYQNSVAKQNLSSKFDIATLPPTSAAARFHIYRAYHQIQTWLGHKLPPHMWGRQQICNTLKPIITDKPPVPDHLLQLIHCKCKLDCSTLRCTCRKSGYV
jgi:hypothetical protein